MGGIIVVTGLSILLAPTQGVKPDNDPLKPRWYWFT